MTDPSGGSAARALRSGALFALLALLLGACQNVVVDLRKIEQPVMLGPSGLPSGKQVGEYKAAAGLTHAAVDTSYGYYHQSSHTEVSRNDLQVEAFQQMGGDPRRAIRDLRIDARAATICIGAGVLWKIDAVLTGTVVEIGAPEARK